MRSMVWRSAVAWLALCGSALAQTTCNPAGSPPGSVGCQPTLPGVMQSTDLFLGWRPSEGKAASRRVSPSQMLEATLPAAFSTLSSSSTATLGALVVSGNTTLNHPLSVTDTSSFFRFGYGATLPLVKMQSAGTDAAGAAQQVLSISQQVTHTGTGGAGAVGALYSASTIDGAPNQDYYAAAFTMTNRALRDNSATPDQAQHGTLFTHQVKDLPSGGLPPGRVMSDSWVQWWVLQDRTNLPSSQGGALVGVEFDIFGNNADDFASKKRFARQVVLNNYAGDAAHPLEWGYGDYWNSFTGGTLDTFFNVVSAYYAGWTVAAIDLSQGTGARANPYIDGVNRGVAIKLRDGAKLGFNGDGATGAYFTHGSSALQYWSSGTQRASISDTGLITGNNLSLGSATLTISSGSMGLSKITASAAAAGAGGGKIELVCGTNAGTAKLIVYAGTSATPVTILDNIGAGVTGC